jgi:hypothetical protein
MIKWLSVLILLSSCIAIPEPHDQLPPGNWLGIIKLDPTPYFANPKAKPLPELEHLKLDEISQGQLPFLFEIIDSSGLYIQFDSGKSFPIAIGRDRSTAKDTITIQFPASNIQAIFDENVIEGTLTTEQGFVFPFVAWFGKKDLFTSLKKTPLTLNNPEYQIQIQWENENDLDTQILYLTQRNNLLTGRFKNLILSGTTQGSKLYLAGFDGNDGVLIEGKIEEAQLLFGTIRNLSNQKGIWYHN